MPDSCNVDSLWTIRGNVSPLGADGLIRLVSTGVHVHGCPCTSAPESTVTCLTAFTHVPNSFLPYKLCIVCGATLSVERTSRAASLTQQTLRLFVSRSRQAAHTFPGSE